MHFRQHWGKRVDVKFRFRNLEVFGTEVSTEVMEWNNPNCGLNCIPEEGRSHSARTQRTSVSKPWAQEQDSTKEIMSEGSEPFGRIQAGVLSQKWK